MSKISTNYEEIVERICGSDISNHEKISTVHEKNVEKFSDQIESVGEGTRPSPTAEENHKKISTIHEWIVEKIS